VKRHIAIQARRESWAIAAVFLVVFCWLGFAAVRFGSIFEGIEVNLPIATRLVFAYGPVGFPLFGIVAAAALILSDALLRSRWMQWTLIAVFAIAVISAFRAMVFSGVFMGPAHRANKPDAVNPAMASRFHFGYHWRGVTDPERSA
jgi:hypothetical protein